MLGSGDRFELSRDAADVVSGGELPMQLKAGREAIQALWENVLAHSPHFEPEQPLPTLVSGNTNAASIMIGERGSDAVLGKRLPRKTSLERPVHALA